MRIVNLSKNTVLAEEAIVADTALMRLKGLLGRKKLKSGEALILKPCNLIHTCFMSFPIDVVFVDKNGQVIKTFIEFRPFRFTPIYFNASFVLELPANTVFTSKTSPGDIIKIEQ